MKKAMLAAFIGLALCGSAQAFRPFDGTDADVAGPGELQLEIGAGRLRLGDTRVLSVPALAATYGLGGDSEIGIEGRINRTADGATSPYRTLVEDGAITFKHLLRSGSLQDGTGPSVAAECALLFPQTGGSHGNLGFGCTGAVSRQWEAFTGHLNVGVERTPERRTARYLSLIGEGPQSWPVRPVSELRLEADTAGGWDRSLLAGVIVPAGKQIAIDVSWRGGRSSDGPLRELRFGLTWTFEPAS